MKSKGDGVMEIHNAKFIWFDKEGKGRNPYGLFRKTFNVQAPAKSALLHVFADTVYQLYVNGEFVEFGPVRFDPRFPQNDTHDIRDLLTVGKNTIAIQVNYIGHKTFKSIAGQGGLIVWGAVETEDGGYISIETKAGTWKGKKSDAYCDYAPRQSFALNAADIYDQRKEDTGWKEADFDDSSWPVAVELENQKYWGKLESRGIPFMSGKSVPIESVVHALKLDKKEEWYSFEVATPFVDQEIPSDLSKLIAYATWIYSPKKQRIQAGSFYGQTWINGKRVPEGLESVTKSLRFNQQWELEEGWNYYFGTAEAFQSAFYHYIALPYGEGLIVSADKNPHSPNIFKRTPIVTVETYETLLKSKTLPYHGSETLEEIGGWIYTTKEESAQCPSREMSWDEFGEAVEKITPENLLGHVFKAADYPHGFTLLLELPHTQLFFPRLQMSGVKGATIDIGYSEHLNRDQAHLRIQSWVPVGDRIICAKDFVDWMTSHPRGGMYISITVRNMTEEVQMDGIMLRSANYPVEERGSFKSDDACLNAVWELGKRTQMANMEDAYVDCDMRERGMYGRDTIIQYHNNLALFGDQALMSRCMELFGQSPDDTGKFRAVYPNTGDYTISDFALNMLEGYLAYYEQTGDKELIERYWSAIVNNLKWFHELADEREDLLLDSEWHIKRKINAHYGGFHGDNAMAAGHLDNTGIHCMFSCTYLIALQCAAKLAEAIGKLDDEKELERRIRILEKSILEKFWDDEKNCFSDNFERKTHSTHANLFIVRAGIANEKQLQAIRAHVAKELKSLFINGYGAKDGVMFSPAFAFYIFDGLYKADLIETAENAIKQGWGWMLSQGLKTCPEFFTQEFSLCHAWSACPTYYLSKYGLGIHYPKAPNLDEVEIRVKAHHIQGVEGVYPHPKGDIEIKWHMEGTQRIFDVVKGPEGVNITIVG